MEILEKHLKYMLYVIYEYLSICEFFFVCLCFSYLGMVDLSSFNSSERFAMDWAT